MIFQIMGPLLVLMLCPIWLLVGMLVGMLSDLVTGQGKRSAPRERVARERAAHRREPAVRRVESAAVRGEPAEAVNRVSQ
ncbi:hypothetical protein AB0H34_39305 [Saccharopolyspora shandongensis]|uniref:hypothetical protein n=1 Tax=Saccharopolyspora shandongensis TaxID=418495 RepID=UPI0033D21185